MALILISDTPPHNTPSGVVLMNNFTYLEGLITGGTGIKSGSTMAQMLATAAAAPTVPFLCIPSDLKALMLYTGVAADGPEANGFVTLASWATIS